MHRNLDELIAYLDRKIELSQHRVNAYTTKKEKLLFIKQHHPDIQCEHGVFFLKDIQDKVSCMSLEKRYSRLSGSQIDIVAKFSLGDKKQHGIKIYSSPVKNVVATILKPYSAKEIVIHNYESLISPECKARRRFLKRIKLFLIDYVIKNKLVISDNSYDRNGFMRLIMLK